MADLNSLLENATPKVKKAKNEKPIIELPKKLKESLKLFLKWKKEEKVAAGEKKAAEAPVLEFCIKKYQEDALAGNFNSSYLVPVDENTKVNFICTDKFSVAQDQISEIKTICGDDFDKLFDKNVNVFLKPEVLSTPELKEEITAILGDKFSKFFASEVHYSTKPDFDENYMEILSVKKQKEMRKFAVQSKPYFK